MTDEEISTRPRFFQRLLKSPTIRFVTIGILVFLMLIPLSMVESIVRERHQAYNEVLTNIGSLWGKEQVLAGPVLVVPYTETSEVIETRIDQEGMAHSVRHQVINNKRGVILPKKLSVEGVIEPEYRYRGIYKSLVYGENLTIEGIFLKAETKVQSLIQAESQGSVHWDRAFLAVGLSDPKGIDHVETLFLGGKQIDLAPGTRVPELMATGFHAPLNIKDTDDKLEFTIKMRIKGSEGFRMAPLGEISKMHLSSKWAHPSFYGDLLPKTHNIGSKGFEADWSISHLVRSYPQSWTIEQSPYSLAEFSAGVRLFEPITIYTESTRAVKYGFLFIALTFLTLVLMELVVPARPSMVQYAMIGVALSLFYLLLIAFSEHVGFNIAYIIASASVIVLITAYCLAVLNRKRLSFVVMVVLAALYSVLFMILRAEDYALLTGSILLLFAVAVTMYFTRGLNRHQDKED
jgi:inner membrane protein